MCDRHILYVYILALSPFLDFGTLCVWAKRRQRRRRQLSISHLKIQSNPLSHTHARSPFNPLYARSWIKFLSKNVTGCRFQLLPPVLLLLYRIVPSSKRKLNCSLPLIFPSLLASCFGALILTAVDMHIMGIERFRFSSLLWLSWLACLPFVFFFSTSASACSLSRDWFSSLVSLAQYFIAFGNRFDFLSFVTFNASLILSDI